MVAVRCDNQHFVPAGSSSCRRCDGGTVAVQVVGPEPVVTVPAAVAPVPVAARADFLTLGEYAARRNRLVVADAGVVVAALVLITGGLPALVAALLTGAAVTGAAAAFVEIAGTRLGPAPGRAPLPATATHVRHLDRLLVTPVAATAVALIVALVRG